MYIKSALINKKMSTIIYIHKYIHTLNVVARMTFEQIYLMNISNTSLIINLRY